mgnify:CR=1 FL=1
MPVNGAARQRARRAGYRGAPAAGAVKTREQLRSDERSNLEAALAACHGKVFGPDGAAQLLGMNRDQIRYRLEKFGLDKLGRPTADDKPA